MQMLKEKVHIDSFLPHVMAFAMGTEDQGMLPEAAARSFIRNAIYSFAEKTGIVKETKTINLQCGLSEYPLETQDCETIIGIKNAEMNSFRTGYDEENHFDKPYCACSWTWGSVNFWIEDDVLHVNPAPSKDVENGLIVELVLAPSRDACDVDTVFYDKWHDAIVNGALAEIHMMPNRPWSSVNRAVERRRMFEEEVSRATIRKVMDYRREPMRISANNNWLRYNSSQRRW